MQIIDWSKVRDGKIVAIECQLCDRPIVIKEIAHNYHNKQVYLWNHGYSYLQQFSEDKLHLSADYGVSSVSEVFDLCLSLSGVLIIEGIGEIDKTLVYKDRKSVV